MSESSEDRVRDWIRDGNRITYLPDEIVVYTRDVGHMCSYVDGRRSYVYGESRDNRVTAQNL